MARSFLSFSFSSFHFLLVFCSPSLLLRTALFLLSASASLHELCDPRCEVVRAHNKESYDFMVDGRQHRGFYWSGLSTNGSVDPDPPNVHAGHHTTSSFYHVVPFYHGVAVSVSLAAEMRSNLREISRCIGPFKPLNGCTFASRIALIRI